MKGKPLSQIDTSEQLVIEPAKEIPFVRRLFAKTFRPAVRQATVVLFDQSFCSIANFLTSVLVARACTKAEYGIYVLGLTLLMTAMGIQTSLSGTPFTVLSPPLKGKDRQFYLGSTLVQHLIISAVASVAFVVAAGVVFITGRTDDFANVLVALAAASVFVLFRNFMRYVLLAQLRVWASLLMGLAANIATVGMLIWAYVGQWLTAPVAYLIMAGCSGPPVFFVLLRERKQIAFATNKLREHIQKNWRFGKWLIARAAAFFFAVQIYPWALMAFKGPNAVGLYGVCITLARVFNPLSVGVSRYLGPKTAHATCRGLGSVRRIVSSAMPILAVPLVFLLVGTFLFGNTGLVRIFGNKYQQAGHVLFVLALGISIRTLTSPITSGIEALWKPRINFVAQLIAAGISLTLGLILTFAFGALGAALGYTLSIALNALYRWKSFSEATQESGAVRYSTTRNDYDHI